MTKLVKIISILLITIMLVATMGQVALAANGAIDNFATNNKNWTSSEISGVTNIASKVLSAVRNIAIIVAVIMISVLGVKYMVGSVEEKANYKKAFIPMIVGAILVASAAAIAKALFNLNA